MPQTAGVPAGAVSLQICGGTDHVAAVNPAEDIPRKDHFINVNGVTCAGRHLIIDLFGASHLNDQARMEAAMREAVRVAGATLLHIHLHVFEPNGGLSGVAVLAESHISVHSWPENNYAAFDVFMCGEARPELTVAVFEEAFSPERVGVRELLRGVAGSD